MPYRCELADLPCIHFLGLPRQSTITGRLNRNLFPHSSGGRKFEIKVWHVILSTKALERNCFLPFPGSGPLAFLACSCRSSILISIFTWPFSVYFSVHSPLLSIRMLINGFKTHSKSRMIPLIITSVKTLFLKKLPFWDSKWTWIFWRRGIKFNPLYWFKSTVDNPILPINLHQRARDSLQSRELKRLSIEWSGG